MEPNCTSSHVPALKKTFGSTAVTHTTRSRPSCARRPNNTRNPLPEQLAVEVERNVDFVTMQASSTPLLGISKVEARSLGDGVYRVEVAVRNGGYQPTELAIRDLRVIPRLPFLSCFSYQRRQKACSPSFSSTKSSIAGLVWDGAEIDSSTSQLPRRWTIGRHANPLESIRLS